MLKPRPAPELSKYYILGSRGAHLFDAGAFPVALNDLSNDRCTLDHILRIDYPPSRIAWRIDHGRTRTAFALRAGIRRAGLRALPGWRHQPGSGRHLRGRPQHDRQLAAETPRIRPVGEAGTRSRRRPRRARPLFARHRLYLRDHPGRAPPRRAGVGAPDGAQAARRSGRHLLAAQPPSSAMARWPRASAGRGTGLEGTGGGVRAGASCRRGRSRRINLGGFCFRTRAVRAGAR
jgi:hypothetical protein